jgi:glutamine synthetase
MSFPQNWQERDQKGKIIAEYIWLGGSGLDLRSKCRTVQRDQVTHPGELDEWNYDGSSTEQAEGRDSEVYMMPKKVISDPLRGGMNVLVLCDTWNPDGSPGNTNFRDGAEKVFNACTHEEPWFSFEQEYVLITTNPDRPIGFPTSGYAEPQGPYYCSNGSKWNFGREIMDAHYRACLFAELNITGTNAEVFPGQWEYQ